MSKMTALAAALVLGLAGMSTGVGATDPALTGHYVEARTAEVFTGPCILGSEGEVSGREAIMAWHVSRGAMNGVALDGLTVVAVVAADRHLSLHELGAPKPESVKSVVMIDQRATAAQQQALVTLARTLAPDVMREIIQTTIVPIAYAHDADGIRLSAGSARLDVTTEFDHPSTCGAMRWFDPLSRTSDAKAGLTRSQEWSGASLGTQWKQQDRKSSFVGTFSIAR